MLTDEERRLISLFAGRLSAEYAPGKGDAQLLASRIAVETVEALLGQPVAWRVPCHGDDNESLGYCYQERPTTQGEALYAKLALNKLAARIGASR